MQASICTVYTERMSLRPDPFTHYTILNEHALYYLVFCVRTLLVNTPFYPGVCVQIHDHPRFRVWSLAGMRERKGCTATVLTSVQGGTWPLAVRAAGRWRWFGSKGRACSSTFFYLRLYFCPFRRDTVFVLQRASSQRTKGEMRKCAETLTSLFRNALISVDQKRKGKNRRGEISRVNGRNREGREICGHI